MDGRSAVGTLVLCLVVVICSPDLGTAQAPPQEEITEGVYEIILKTPDRRSIIVDRLVRDRDLDAKAMFRVTADGYMAFDEHTWVDRIEFKVFDVPVTQLPEYKEFTRTLVEINKRVWEIKRVLRSYDELSLRLMNLCDKSLFPNLRHIDENIRQQLSIYRNLVLLKSLVTNSLETFVRERSCVDKFAEYHGDLKLYTERLTNLCRNYERLRKQALRTIDISKKGAVPSDEAPIEEETSEEPKRVPTAPPKRSPEPGK